MKKRRDKAALKPGAVPDNLFIFGLQLAAHHVVAVARAGQPFVEAAVRTHQVAAALHSRLNTLKGDLDEAERLLLMAIDRGDVESMWDMGRLVEQRDGIDASEPWFRMAAENGHFFAKRFFRPGHALNLDGKNPL